LNGAKIAGIGEKWQKVAYLEGGIAENGEKGHS